MSKIINIEVTEEEISQIIDEFSEEIKACFKIKDFHEVEYHHLVEFIVLIYLYCKNKEFPILTKFNKFLSKRKSGFENIFLLNNSNKNNEINLRLSIYEVKSYKPNSINTKYDNELKKEDLYFEPTFYKIKEAFNDVVNSAQNKSNERQNDIYQINSMLNYDDKFNPDFPINTDFKDDIQSFFNGKIQDVNELYEDLIFLEENFYTKFISLGTISKNQIAKQEFFNEQHCLKNKNHELLLNNVEKLTQIVISSIDSNYYDVFNQIRNLYIEYKQRKDNE